MTRWGSVDTAALRALQARLQQLDQGQLEQFCTSASKELAARLLALVIPRTPVGSYPRSSGKKGGTLRRGWTGGKRQGGLAYAKSLPITKNGHEYTIEIINPVEYASYVEFGHRTRGGSGWVSGQYFLTLSEEDLNRIAPAVLEKKLDKYLREILGNA